ncbi:spore cortex-lytic enzyme [Paludifilum halophilum]|uniref:spore cortex-lytic enzyme n=1 Tax=Paludifilum halophilum TaxID=1642702 RepID=UPI001F0A0BAA|nr:spore cortex-lytic enzyme [Paludifilum halophilum]
MQKRLLITCLTAVIAITGFFLPAGVNQAEAAAPTTISYGSENGDVWDLQNRLNRLGYKIEQDGIYGLETEQAVIQYQKANDLRIDGIAGPETWTQLKKATPKVSPKDLHWLARAIHAEARGEPFKGKVAVAAVVLNRMDSSDYPDTAKGVVMEEGAFTAVDDGQIWLSPNNEAYQAAQTAVKGWDPSQGAMFYFNPDTATSEWIWSRPQIDKIGKHIFAK